MQKIKYFPSFITQSYFSVQKVVRLNWKHYFIMKINNKRVSRDITIDHSADIDCTRFMKIYREFTKTPFNFLTIDTTLLANDLLIFRRDLLPIYKNDSN